MGKKGKKGGGKGKKGKKGEKKGPGKKMEKAEEQMKFAAQSAVTWEYRLNEANKAKVSYEKQAAIWKDENKLLNHQLGRAEKDALDVVSLLRKQDDNKQRKIDALEVQLHRINDDHQAEINALLDKHGEQTKDLEQKLGEKSRELEWLQGELNMVRQFRRDKDKMQQQLEEIKGALQLAESEHTAAFAQAGQKFLEEKLRLQAEANEKLKELSRKAHQEAIQNVDEASRSVFKENVRLAAALTMHQKNESKLAETKKKLKLDNYELKDQVATVETIVKDKISNDMQHKKRIAELEGKVEILEKTLTHVIQEFENELAQSEQRSGELRANAEAEVTRLKRVLTLKDRELSKIKQVAGVVIKQRTDMEKFFLSALDYVKTQIEQEQAAYKKDANAAYRDRMNQAHRGFGPPPPVRTFNGGATKSTNSVLHDLAQSKLFNGISNQEPVDISQLTWEQKENVLRLLFARMNAKPRSETADDSASDGSSTRRSAPLGGQLALIDAPPTSWTRDRSDASSGAGGATSPDHDATFVTTQIPNISPRESFLPPI